MNARAVLVVIALAGAMLFARPARADDREDAKREFAAGQAADKAKDWQGALEHYLAAYEKLAHPFALYNIGNDYEQLGNLREAAHYYQRYVDASPDSADRARVTKLLAELKVRPSKLVVRSIPGGGRVSVDGAPVGDTPYTGSVRAGTHHLSAEQNGAHQEQDITAEYGEPIDVTLKLHGGGGPGNFVPPAPGGPTGTILVRGTPAGALVTVDELAAGVTPVAVPVTPGAHQVRVTQVGFQEFDQTAIVTAGMVTEVDAPLQPGSGPLGNGPAIALGYLVGLDGGADVRGNGALVEFDFGFRIASYEGIIGIGKFGSTTAVDFTIRWNFLKDSRLTPFIGAGYSYINNGSGYLLSGGLRLDVARTDSYGFALLATASARIFSGTTTDMSGNEVDSSGVLVPLTLSLVATKFR